MTQPDHAESLRLIEALLFASASPVTELEIADRLPEGSDVSALLTELEEHYRARGVMLAKIAGGWTYRTAPDLASRLKLETTVDRTKFGLNWNNPLPNGQPSLANDVTLSAELYLVKA